MNHHSSRETVSETLERLSRPIDLLMMPELSLPLAIAESSSPQPAVLAVAEALTRPSDLPYQLTRAYDLSVSRALEASIPVVGGGAVSAQRRVIVLERVGYDERPASAGGMDHVGFAIRLCVTVNKLDANVKLSLPFITASAQLGSTEAAWMLQVVGLTGPKIAAVGTIPTELNVETFVIAKQSLQTLIEALTDSETTLSPKVIAHEGPPSTVEARYAPIVAQVAALGSIVRGWSMQDAAARFGWNLATVPGSFAAVYQDVAGIQSVSARPAESPMGLASKILGNVNAKPR
ncbi:MAG: hypothetical protein JNN27_03565 [Planctomycetes bacterium]|nr:hypothetical protein [Planctomycetota bacterium]